MPITIGRCESGSADNEDLRSGEIEKALGVAGSIETGSDISAVWCVSSCPDICDICRSPMGVASPEVSPNRLAGAATPTEELGELERAWLSRNGKKLELICLDCGGGGGKAFDDGNSFCVKGEEVDAVGLLYSSDNFFAASGNAAAWGSKKLDDGPKA